MADHAGPLLTERRFGPLFLTQSLSAFNGNLCKTAMLFLLTFGSAGSTVGRGTMVSNKATRSTYARPIEQTLVIVTEPGGLAKHLALPRYQAFTGAAAGLALGGADFVEIAGNRGPIVVTLLAGPTWLRPAKTRQLFQQPILTQPGRYRYAVSSRVADLATVMRSFDASKARIEHIYDY